MKSKNLRLLSSAAVLIIAPWPTSGQSAGAQSVGFLSLQVTVGPTTRGTPYSGEGVASEVQVSGDGRRIERRLTVKVYRDGSGRVRVEDADVRGAVTIVDPVDGVVYTFDRNSSVARRTPFDARLFGGAAPASSPSLPTPNATGVPDIATSLQRDRIQQLQSAMRFAEQGISTRTEQLVPRFVARMQAVGSKTTIRVPQGRIGNDRSIEITHEWWESPELRGVALLYRYHDPRTGDVEYQLTKIARAEPSRDLFTVPSNYRIVDDNTPER